MINKAIRHAKRVVIFTVGITVLALGIIFIFTPGPAIVIIPLGLAILATEFVWARVLLENAKQKAKNVHKTIFGKKTIRKIK